MTITDLEPQVRPVEVLTDEELSLLTYGPGAVVTPYFSEVAARDTELVQRTAYRGLVARGIVDPSGVPGGALGSGPARLSLRDDVMTLVSLRQAATTLVAVARTMIDRQDFWYAHVVEDLVVLEEVSGDGLHRFALGFTRDLPTLLLEAALHPDATDGAGAEVSIDAMPDEDAPAQLLEVLGRAHVRADVVVLTAESSGQRPELTGLFTGPEGSWSVTSSPTSGAVARPESLDTVRARLRDLADRAMSA